MQANEKELRELFGQLNIEESKRQEILGDITRGDEFFKQQVEPEIPNGLIERVSKGRLVDQAVTAGEGQKRWMSRAWLRPVAAVIVTGFLVIALMMLDKNQNLNSPEAPVNPVTFNSSDEMNFLDDEFGLWIAASTLEEELDQEMNDLAISEILVLWDDAGWEIDNILGKERDHESDTILTRRRVGAFVV